jgi:2-amino-4-hydroxy-6-hydroxymethyldihydropteridine diphosphokinase
LNTVYLGLGGNLGDREAYLNDALLELGLIGAISKKSTIIETPAWGITDAPNYLNMVVCLHTAFWPLKLMQTILTIEEKLGRQRTQKWGSRVIDIDILFFNDWVISTEGLNIPHPFIVERLFVLKPMNEINSQFIHPTKGQCISQLHQQLLNEPNS